MFPPLGESCIVEDMISDVTTGLWVPGGKEAGLPAFFEA
jgi:hypothetical protein